MKVFITGISGLLGSNCLQELIKSNFEISALVRENSIQKLSTEIISKINIVKGDLFDYFLLEKELKHFDIVIHCAAEISFNPQKKFMMHDVNVLGTQNIVNACLKNNIKQLIHISSIAALGRNGTTKLIDEETKWVDSEFNTNYAISKYNADLEVWRGAEEGLNVTVLHPSVILGEHLKDRSSSKLFSYVMNENLFYTDGNLNYVDVKDVVKVIILSVNNKDAYNQSFILNGGAVSFKVFFETVAKLFNKKAPYIRVNRFIAELAWRIEFLKSIFTKKEPLVTKETARTSRTNYNYNNQKACELFNFQFTDLNTTLNRVCKFYLN